MKKVKKECFMLTEQIARTRANQPCFDNFLMTKHTQVVISIKENYVGTSNHDWSTDIILGAEQSVMGTNNW